MRRMIAGGLAVLALVGCGAQQESSVPEATSTISVPGVGTSSSAASASASDAASESASDASSDIWANDKSAAQRVYREFLDREMALYERGGSRDARSELASVAADPLLSEEVQSMRGQLNSGLRAIPGSRYSVRVKDARAKAGQVTLTSCEDYRTMRIRNRQGEIVRAGKLYKATVRILKGASGWRVVSADSAEVGTC